MRTVKQLKDELDKFPDDAICYAYEGEVCGVVIRAPDGKLPSEGFIPCSEGVTPGYDKPTTLLTLQSSVPAPDDEGSCPE